MPTRKAKKSVVKKTPKKVIASVPKRKDTSISFSGFSVPQSYTSLLLGFLFVFILAVGFVFFLKNKSVHQPQALRQEVSSTKTTVAPTNIQAKTLPKINNNIHVVKSGESLWDIAVQEYGDGYKWVNIAQANNLKNPGMLYKDMSLTLPTITGPPSNTIAQATPSITPAVPATQISNTITTNSYTVQKGDDLWHIAVRAYGDGYRYIDIVKANNLANPSLIFSGNVLTIPR